MAIGNMDLYKALKEAGASDEAAVEAAKSVASQLPRFWALTGTLATLAALNLGVLGLQFHLGERLASVEANVAALEPRVTGIEQRVTGVEQRLTGVEQRLTALEEHGAQWHNDIMQQFEALRRERGGGQP
jgi:hypothetical protein